MQHDRNRFCGRGGPHRKLSVRVKKWPRMAFSIAFNSALTPTAFNDAEWTAKISIKLLHIQIELLAGRSELNYLKFYFPILVPNFYRKSFLHYLTHVQKQVS